MSISPTSSNAPVNTTPLDRRSKELRRKIVGMIEAGGRGHVGSAFSLVEMLRILYDEVLRFDPVNPRWPERDRFVLSKGHGCLALYVLLAEKGFFPESELWKFCKSDGILGGHPEYGKVPGVEASTGSLGHGLSFGVGFMLMTLATVILGELVPKAIGIQKAEGILLLAAGPLRLLGWMLYPIVTFTNASATATLKLIGLPPAFGEETAHTEEELRAILASSHARGQITRVGRDILERVLGFSHRSWIWAPGARITSCRKAASTAAA